MCMCPSSHDNGSFHCSIVHFPSDQRVALGASDKSELNPSVRQITNGTFQDWEHLFGPPSEDTSFQIGNVGSSGLCQHSTLVK